MENKTLAELIAQEMVRADSLFGERGFLVSRLLNENQLRAVKGFLTSLADTVARATAEKLDVEDKEEGYGVGDKQMYEFGWNANNAERRRRMREWLGEEV